MTGDQADIIAFLADPSSHDAGVSEVERIDTHASVVFLAGAPAARRRVRRHRLATGR